MRMKAIFGLTLLLASSATLADEGAADYRHHTMEAIGGHTTAVFDILQGKVPHQAHLAAHASAIAEMAAIAHTLFPEGSIGGHAKAAIWEQPEVFAERMQGLSRSRPRLSGCDSGRRRHRPRRPGPWPSLQRLPRRLQGRIATLSR